MRIALVVFLFSINAFGEAKHQGAKSEQATALIGAGTNGVVSYMMFDACYSTEPIGWHLCALGALSAAQAALNMSAAGGAGKSADASYSCPGCFDAEGSLGDVNGGGLNPATSIDGGPYKTVGELQTALKHVNQKMKESGFSVSEDGQTVTGPNGETYSAASLNAAATTGAGLSPEEFNKVKEALDKAKKITSEYSVASANFDSGGGGGSYQFTPYEADSTLSDYLSKLRAGDRKPAAVAGLQRVVNGEPIGVKGDDIFQMVHRRYQAKRKANIFFETLAPTKKPQ